MAQNATGGKATNLAFTPKKKQRRLTEDRRRFILDLVDKEGSVFVTRLANELSVSTVTVRKDLNALAEEGLVFRAHGGAVKADSTLVDRALAEKQAIFAEEKAAIAARAASIVYEGQSIILDSGSTTTQIARALRGRRNLTVITNAINIALELSDSPGIEVILTGGSLRKRSSSVVGLLANLALAKLAADIFFLGVDGIDPEFGYMTPNVAEAATNQQMIKIAREVVVVADQSKFGHRSLAVICPPESAKRIITTSLVDPKYVEAFESMGVEMDLV